MKIQRILFSHHLFNGFATAAGVIGIASVGYLAWGMPVAMLLSSGAMVVSIADRPCPPSGKLRQMFLPLLLATLITGLEKLAAGHAAALAVLVLAVSFIGPMLTAFGRSAQPLGFLPFLALVFGMAVHGRQSGGVLHDTSLFAAGGALYLLCSIAGARLLLVRTKQQVLAEALHAFADLSRTRARMYDPDADIDAIYLAQIRDQANLTEKLQNTREFVFRQIRPERGGALANALLALLDAYEASLSGDTDRPILREQFKDEPIMSLLGAMVEKLALDTDRMALDLARGRTVAGQPDYEPDFAQINRELQQLKTASAGVNLRARPLMLLEGAINKLRHTARALSSIPAGLHQAVSGAALPDEEALRPFITRIRYRPSQLREHLRISSPVFRFSLRMCLAMSIGFGLTYLLPYASHPHWILLTIAVVLRASFSQTRQRHNDRVLGNLLGCVVAGALLHLSAAPAATLLALFFALAIAHGFVTLNYRITAIAACVMGLLQLHLLMPDARFVMSERIIDTLIGAGIAFACSFVLPNWEQESIPSLVERLTAASRAYVEQALSFAPDPLAYRLARRQLLDMLAALTQAIERMANEPKARRLPLAPLNRVLTLGHGLVAHLAAVRFLLLRRAADLDPAASESLLAQARNRSAAILDTPRKAPRETGAATAPDHDLPGGKAENLPLKLLHLRLEETLADVDRFAASASGIVRA